MFPAEPRDDGRSAIVGSSEQPEPTKTNPMKTLATLVNVIAFTALFVAYSASGSIEKPSGVRRALQTYAGQLPTGAFPTLKPVWQIGVEASDLI